MNGHIGQLVLGNFNLTCVTKHIKTSMYYILLPWYQVPFSSPIFGNGPFLLEYLSIIIYSYGIRVCVGLCEKKLHQT